MRSDYQTLREIITGFSHPPAQDPAAARRARPRRELRCLVPDALEAQDLDGAGRSSPYLHTLRGTLERRSSSTAYSPEPLEAGLLLATVREALMEEEGAWQGRGAGGPEVFVLLLRPRGAEPGIYRVRREGADLVADLPAPEQVEGMTVQKEFAQAGAIVSAAADLEAAEAWGGAHGYRHAMGRCASLIYSVHLRAVARGLVGTVFAGFASSEVRHLLDSDGVSRHQMFAVTVAHPAQERSP
ncbi:hypothetical protein J5X07_08195 [Actinomyces bowdenii]|uniref:hypothetical protein n=1 Tax=Actinomyces bowdenii TaxID=131109 RepID=UPI001ABCFB7D|nr:hypothetical protein [Actinomyces bowdenii]MBO3725006.1 hypothetical protein [Actinomyces bowdenii]